MQRKISSLTPSTGGLAFSAPSPPVGTYAEPPPQAVRSPCPVLNALANHGHLPRDGRSITFPHLVAALETLGITNSAAYALASAPFKLHTAAPHFWTFLKEDTLGLRTKDDVDEQGVPILDLGMFNQGPGYIEHDVSLTRQDRAEGDPISADPVLLLQMLGKGEGKREHESLAVHGRFTVSSFANLRRLRYRQQATTNPSLQFGKSQHGIACGEIAGMLGVFSSGQGYGVPMDWMEALLQQERLPTAEGWKPRSGWFKASIPEVLAVWYVVKVLSWPWGVLAGLFS